ncbi:unnamed protein product, partial [marine sediment metagenome]
LALLGKHSAAHDSNGVGKDAVAIDLSPDYDILSLLKVIHA